MSELQHSSIYIVVDLVVIMKSSMEQDRCAPLKLKGRIAETILAVLQDCGFDSLLLWWPVQGHPARGYGSSSSPGSVHAGS